MKKFILIAFFGLFFFAIPAMIFAQGEDSVDVLLEEPTDTISIDNMDPTFYEEEAPEEKSDNTLYIVIAAIVVIGGVAYFVMKNKKK